MLDTRTSEDAKDRAIGEKEVDRERRSLNASRARVPRRRLRPRTCYRAKSRLAGVEVGLPIAQRSDKASEVYASRRLDTRSRLTEHDSETARSDCAYAVAVASET